MVIHMEEKRTFVRLPQDRYDEVNGKSAVLIRVCLREWGDLACESVGKIGSVWESRED